MDVSNRTAFVTGAASGIGLATAEALARRGGALALLDVSAPRLAEAEQKVRAAGASRVTTHVADVGRADQVEAAAGEALQAHGPFDFVFANAGVGLIGVPISRARSVDAQWVLNVNALGVFETARVLLPSMLASGKPGAFVCTSSLAALFLGPGGHGSLYSASKYAVMALAEGIREECGDAPIEVSVVYPGPIVTDIEANVGALRPAGGPAATLPPALSEMTATFGISAAAAAEIILQGVEAKLSHIMTHPDLVEKVYGEYVETIQAGVEGSKRLKSVYRVKVPAA